MQARTCQFNPFSGHGIVHDADGQIYTFKVKSNGVADGPKLAQEGFHSEMWLQGGDVCTIPCDEYPYTQAKDTMIRLRQRYRLLTFFLMAIDSQIDRSGRYDAAKLFEQIYAAATPEAIAEFEEIMLDEPTPADASTKDAPFRRGSKGAKLLARMVATYGHRPLPS